MKNLKAVTDVILSNAQGFYVDSEENVQKIIRKLSQGASVFYGNVDNEGMTVLIVDADIKLLEPFIGRIDWRDTDSRDYYDIYDVLDEARRQGEIDENQMSDLFAIVERLGDCDCTIFLVFSVLDSEYVITEVATEKVKRNSWKHDTITRNLAIGAVGIPSVKAIKEDTSNY